MVEWHHLFVNRSAADANNLLNLGSSLGYSNVTIQNNVAYNWNQSYIDLGASAYNNVSIQGNTFQDTLYGSALAGEQ